MGLRFRCPSCDTMNRIEEEDRGRKVRCMECDERFRVPAADPDEGDEDREEEERPRRRKKKKAAGMSGLMIVLIVLGGVGLVVLLAGGVGAVVIYKIAQAGNRIQAAADRHAAQDRRNNMNPGDFGIVPKGKMLIDKRGNLLRTDPADPTPEMREVNARMQVHQLNMQVGKTYVIDLRSNAFDAYLRVENPGGRSEAEDDDSGEGPLDSRIVFRPTQNGMHRVIVTSWDGQTGAYHLTVQEAQ